jgi:hypothetical protein
VREHRLDVAPVPLVDPLFGPREGFFMRHPGSVRWPPALTTLDFPPESRSE